MRDITLILISFGDGILSIIEIDKELLAAAKEQWSYAEKLIKEAWDSGRPKGDFLSSYEREEIANKCSEKTKKAEQNYQDKLDEIAKKRFMEYWDNHQAEKDTLESKKNT